MPPIQIITFFFVLFSYVEFYEKFKPLMLTIHVKAILETIIWGAGSLFMDMILHVFLVKTHLCTLLIPILWQKLLMFMRCRFVFGLIIFIQARYRDANNRNIRVSKNILHLWSTINETIYFRKGHGFFYWNVFDKSLSSGHRHWILLTICGVLKGFSSKTMFDIRKQYVKLC